MHITGMLSRAYRAPLGPLSLLSNSLPPAVGRMQVPPAGNSVRVKEIVRVKSLQGC